MNLSLFLNAFIGGTLVGLGAFLLMLINGRIAGVSGIFFSAITTVKQNYWRRLFLLGLILSPILTSLFGFSLPSEYRNILDNTSVSSSHSYLIIIFGGLLVGIGTYIGSGCTSGHGICGISRLSIRSIIATVIFLASAVITVTLITHTFGAIL